MKMEKDQWRNLLNEGKKIVEKKGYKLGFGHLGNGISVWNSNKEEHGDYQKVAHIDRNRKITYYIKNLPADVKKEIEAVAKGPNSAVSTTQPHMKVFKEAKNYTHKTITANFKTGRLTFDFVDENDNLIAVSWKKWIQSPLKDKSTDHMKEEMFNALVRKVSSANLSMSDRIDFNTKIKKLSKWEDKMKYAMSLMNIGPISAKGLPAKK